MDAQAPSAVLTGPAVAPRSARGFCLLWAGMALAFAALVAAFDAAVDPYLVVGAPRLAGFNAVKPEIETHTALAKDHLIARARPAGLLLGDSKVDIGLDPESASWPEDARPAFNDGVPGLAVEDVLARLKAGVATGPVRRALVMLNMLNLLTPPDPPKGPASSVLGAPASDLLLSTLSLDALRASLATVASQRRRAVYDMTDLGASSEGGFQATASREGYDALFVRKDMDLPAMFRTAVDARRDRNASGAPRLGAVAEMIAFCGAHGVELDLVIPPSHADYLEAMGQAGLWPSYERAKADLTRLAAKGGAGVRLWDFGGYDAYTTEAVPGPSERGEAMEWFWEPTHFKKRLGEKVLAAVYQGAKGYGAPLTPDTIDAHLADDERARAAYDADGARERLARAAR